MNEMKIANKCLSNMPKMWGEYMKMSAACAMATHVWKVTTEWMMLCYQENMFVTHFMLWKIFRQCVFWRCTSTPHFIDCARLGDQPIVLFLFFVPVVSITHHFRLSGIFRICCCCWCLCFGLASSCVRAFMCVCEDKSQSMLVTKMCHLSQ